MAKYLALQRHYLDGRIVEAGETVEYTGAPGKWLEPVDDKGQPLHKQLDDKGQPLDKRDPRARRLVTRADPLVLPSTPDINHMKDVDREKDRNYLSPPLRQNEPRRKEGDNPVVPARPISEAPPGSSVPPYVGTVHEGSTLEGVDKNRDPYPDKGSFYQDSEKSKE